LIVVIDERNFISYTSKTLKMRYDVHPAFYSMGIFLLSRGTEQLGRDVDHSPSSSAKVNKACSHTPAPSICFPGLDKNILTLCMAKETFK
jgi:hypothetical protein